MQDNIVLSNEEKKEYLKTLVGKVIKILHLIEEEETTHNSPKNFISGQIREIKSANELFDNKLIDIIIKLKIVYEDFAIAPFVEIKKQIFEIKNKLNYLIQNIE